MTNKAATIKTYIFFIKSSFPFEHLAYFQVLSFPKSTGIRLSPSSAVTVIFSKK
jgi:hypothetical protein